MAVAICCQGYANFLSWAIFTFVEENAGSGIGDNYTGSWTFSFLRNTDFTQGVRAPLTILTCSARKRTQLVSGKSAIRIVRRSGVETEATALGRFADATSKSRGFAVLTRVK